MWLMAFSFKPSRLFFKGDKTMIQHIKQEVLQVQVPLYSIFLCSTQKYFLVYRVSFPPENKQRKKNWLIFGTKLIIALHIIGIDMITVYSEQCNSFLIRLLYIHFFFCIFTSTSLFYTLSSQITLTKPYLFPDMMK